MDMVKWNYCLHETEMQNCLLIKTLAFVAFPLPSPSSELKVPNWLCETGSVLCCIEQWDCFGDLTKGEKTRQK